MRRPGFDRPVWTDIVGVAATAVALGAVGGLQGLAVAAVVAVVALAASPVVAYAAGQVLALPVLPEVGPLLFAVEGALLVLLLAPLAREDGLVPAAVAVGAFLTLAGLAVAADGVTAAAVLVAVGGVAGVGALTAGPALGEVLARE